jgi:hypothetical protein
VYGFPGQPTIEEAETRAIAWFEKAIELKPDYAEAWLQLSRTHAERKEYGQAITAAKEATRLAPREWRSWYALGLCYIDAGSYAEAIEALRQGEKVVPTDKRTGVLWLLGEAYDKKGDREQVLRIYGELKNTKPKMAEVFFREYVLPQPWNARALTASYHGMEINENDHHILIFYVIENTTDQDYRVETKEDISLNAKLAQQQSLAPFDDSAKVQYPIFIPSKQRVRVGIEIQYPYSGKKEPSTKVLEELEEYVRTQFKNLDGFVLFDSKNRYQINFPKPNPPLSSR